MFFNLRTTGEGFFKSKRPEKVLFQILELLSPLYYSNNIYCLQYIG